MVHRQKTNNNMDLQFVDLDLVDLVVVDRSSTYYRWCTDLCAGGTGGRGEGTSTRSVSSRCVALTCKDL